MAESICGPSNPFKTIQTHLSIDRTLQQDRLLPRNSQNKDFRSSTAPSTAQAEVEFEEFHNGIFQSDHAFLPSSIIHDCSQSLNQTPQPPPISTWASDFQKLNFSDDFTRKVQNTSFLQTQQTYEKDREWYQDFNQQRLGNPDMPLSQKNHPLNMMISRDNTFPLVNSVDETIGRNQNVLLDQKQYQPVGEIYDQDDFARVFEQLSETEFNGIHHPHYQKPSEIDRDTSMSKSTNDITSQLKDDVHLTQVPIGADAINHLKTAEEDDSDSLSRTALRLLNSVQDDQSPKFQNSQFLELMRLFRDKKATVEGDQVVGEVLRTENNGVSLSIGEIEPVSSHGSDLIP